MLDFTGISGDAAFKYRRGARHLRDAAGQQARCAGFGRGDLHILFAQLRNDRFLQAAGIHAVYAGAEPAANLLHDRVAQRRSSSGIRRARGHAQHDFSVLGIGRDRRVRTGQQIGQPLRQRRFGDAEHTDGAGKDRAAGVPCQIRRHIVVEHGDHFPRRAGQHHHTLPIPLHGAAGRGSVVVRKHGAAAGEHRLLPVVFGHFPPGGTEIFLNAVPAFFVQLLRQIQRGTDGFFCQIIRRRAETARQHHQIAAAQGGFQHLLQTVAVIADRGLIQHPDAVGSQLLGQKLTVGIENIAQQQLCSDGNDFSVHKNLPMSGQPTFLANWPFVRRFRRAPPAGGYRPALPRSACPRPAPARLFPPYPDAGVCGDASG